MNERPPEQPTLSWGKALVAWILVAVGAVLMVRLIVKGLDVVGVAVTWLQGGMVLVWGWISPVDLAIAGIVLVLGILSLLRQHRNVTRATRRHDRS